MHVEFWPSRKYFGLLLAPRNCRNCIFAGFRLLFQKVFNMKARNLVYGVMEDRFMYMFNFRLLGKFLCSMSGLDIRHKFLLAHGASCLMNLLAHPGNLLALLCLEPLYQE